MKTFTCSLLFILFLLSGCKKNENPVSVNEEHGKITIGETVELITQPIGPSGGEIKIDKPGDVLDGLEIIIPANAFTETKIFKISYTEIKSHQFGQYFNPISPLVSISTDGGYSEIPIEVRVPIKLPKDNFAMGFFYDPQTGDLEGIPIESLDSSLITLSTMTFSSGSSAGKNYKTGDIPPMLQMVISSISESLLKGQAVISSGFLPGYDDWEFVNYGSYIAPGGHCAGQSITAMWYYYEKHLKGEPNLYHRYDELNFSSKPDSLWQDNPYGYRFASVIQKDFNFDGWIRNLQIKTYFPGLIFKAFAVSILITGEPQFVLIRNSAGQGGHAMIVYKVHYNEGKLYIADPNYPNNRTWDGKESIRTINYVNGVLGPYETGLVSGPNSLKMDQIGYFGKTSYIKWDQITKRWAEFENKTIGNTSFPAYQLKIQNDGDKELIDQYNTNKDTLKLYCQCPGAVGIDGTDKMWVQIFDNSAKKISRQADEFAGFPIIQLKNGLNKIGIYIQGFVDEKWKYLDFKWISINRYSLEIEPKQLVGEINVPQTFTARTFGSAPNPFKLIWNFGDGLPEETALNDSIIKHTFTNSNIYNISAMLYNQNNLKLAEAKSTAIILSTFWKWPYINIVVRDINASVEIFYPNSNSYDTIPWSNMTFGHQPYFMTKSGNVFDGIKDTVYDWGTYMSHDSGTVNISIDESSYDIRTIKVSDFSTYNHTSNTWIFEGTDIPFYWMSETNLQQRLENNIRSHISKLEWYKVEDKGLPSERRFRLIEITGTSTASIEIYWASEPP